MARPKGRTVRRADVIIAGLALLEEEGPEAVTLSRVAGRLGLRTPSLYNHVSGSDDLQQAVVVETLEVAATAVLSAVQPDLIESDPGRYLKQWASSWRTYALANSNQVHYMMAAPLDWSRPPFSPTWERMMEGIGAAVSRIGLTGPAAMHAGRFVIASAQGFVRLELRGSMWGPLSHEESFAWMLDRIIGTIEAQARAQG